MPRWGADPSASFSRRLGKSAFELGETDNDEKLIVIPGTMLRSAKADIPDE
jgi:hypothetical protein